MNDHSFCRRRLSVIMKEVRSILPKSEIDKANTYRSTTHLCFYDPDGHAHYGKCCLWHTSSEGWLRYLQEKGCEIDKAKTFEQHFVEAL